jgi:hypothetical protein
VGGQESQDRQDADESPSLGWLADFLLFRQALSLRHPPQLAENTTRIALANFADYFREIATLVLGAANAEQRSGKHKLRVLRQLR